MYALPFFRPFCSLAVLLLALVGLSLLASPQARAADGTIKNIAVLIPGNEKDGGFMEAAYRGYEKIKTELKVDVTYVSRVSATSESKALTEAMRALAKAEPDMIIGHGGQCNGPAQTLSKEYPHIQFVVTQGSVKGANLTSYAVDQEQSAWLAGALAGLMTKSGKVGHISGAWPKPGLRARAAFYHGLMHTNSQAKFYSTFTGNLDDAAINAKAADAQMAEGVDVIYTMLNGGRTGVNERVKSTGGRVVTIGNVIDWTKVDDIFIGSAVADSSVAMFDAARDFAAGNFQPGSVKLIGLEDPAVVTLTMSSKVPADVRERIEKLRADIIKGDLKVETEYAGPEFSPESKTFVGQTAKEQIGK